MKKLLLLATTFLLLAMFAGCNDYNSTAHDGAIILTKPTKSPTI